LQKNNTNVYSKIARYPVFCMQVHFFATNFTTYSTISPMTKTVLIVEDHPLYRGALIHLIQAIVGENRTIAVNSAEDGLRLITNLPPLGLLLLDLGLPGLSGIEAITAFQRKLPTTPIIVVSASEDRQEATSALRAGAKVFISKAVSSEIMTDVVKRLLSQTIVESEWITQNGKMMLGAATPLKITPRQQETLVLLSQGYSNKEIGLRMGLAEITVKVHVSAIFRALDVVNRTQAVLAARRVGLCSAADERTAFMNDVQQHHASSL